MLILYLVFPVVTNGEVRGLEMDNSRPTKKQKILGNGAGAQHAAPVSKTVQGIKLSRSSKKRKNWISSSREDNKDTSAPLKLSQLKRPFL